MAHVGTMAGGSHVPCLRSLLEGVPILLQRNVAQWSAKPQGLGFRTNRAKEKDTDQTGLALV